MSWAIWITGLPGSGKSSIARGLAAELSARGEAPVVLEMDAVRRVVTPSPRYTAEERELVYRALVHVACVLAEAGVPVIIDATGHRRAWRDLARAAIPSFAEAQLVCPFEVCRDREHVRPAGHAPQGIYAAAGRPGATVPGVDVPYEEALGPEVIIDTVTTDVAGAVAGILPVALELAGTAAPKRRAPGRMSWALWLTGLPGSGKTTLAEGLAEALTVRGLDARVLDVECLRQLALAGARPSPAEDDLVHRALVVAAASLAEAGVRVIIDAMATRRTWRALARERIRHFAEVQLLCPLGLCCERERAVRWSLSPCAPGGRPKAAPTEGPDVALDYQHSLSPDLTLRTDTLDVRSATRELVRLAEQLERSAATSPASRTEENPMRVRDLMTRGLITVSPQTSVTEARALMANERIRHLLVTDGGRLAGIVTDRDIRLTLASPATTLSVWELNYLLAKLTVGEVMTKSVIVVEPDRDAREAARIMLDHKIGALPVLDGERIAGILTETDLVRAFAESAEPAATAR
jgi:adenylylsulfate kinase